MRLSVCEPLLERAPPRQESGTVTSDLWRKNCVRVERTVRGVDGSSDAMCANGMVDECMWVASGGNLEGGCPFRRRALKTPFCSWLMDSFQNCTHREAHPPATVSGPPTDSRARRATTARSLRAEGSVYSGRGVYL